MTANITTGQILNSVKNVVVSCNPNATAYFNLNVNVSVIGIDNNPYVGACNLVLTEKSGSPIYGNASALTYSGGANYGIYFKNPGPKTLVASCGGVFGYSNVTVLPEVVTVNGPNPLPQFSNNSFWVGVTFTDAFGNLESPITNPAGHPVTLNLISNTSVSGYSFTGPTTITAIGGVANFTNLQILSSGNFVFKATTDIGVFNSTTPVNITNFVKNVYSSWLTPPPVVSTYGNYSFVIKLTGDDNNTFVLPTFVSLSVNGSSWKVYNTSNGVIQDSIVFLTPGTAFLDFETGLNSLNITNNLVNVTVIPASLSLSVSSLPTNTSSMFIPTVKLYDSLVTKQLLPVNNLPITLNLICNGTCSAPPPQPITVNTTNGIATFPAMSILSAGQFDLQASAFQTLPSMIVLSNMTNFVKSVIVSSNTNTSTAFFNFNVSVNVIGTDNYPYVGSCNLVLTEKSGSPIFGNSALLTTNGSANYSIYFKTPGVKTIQTSCGGVTGSTIVNIVPEVVSFNGPNPLPQFSNNSFWVGVTFTDAFGNLESPINNPAGHPVTLNLVSNTSVSGYSFTGPTTITAIGGVANFTNLQILSSGNFVFKATTDIGVFNSTTPVNITNFVKNVYSSWLSPPPVVSTYGNYSFVIKLTGDDNNAFVLPTFVSLSVNGSSWKVYNSSNGVIQDSIIFLTPGTAFLDFETGLNSLNITNTHVNVSVVPASLSLSVSSMPLNTSSMFIPTVKLYDSLTTKQLIPANNVPVTLNLICNGTCSAPPPQPIIVNTTNGIATFPAMSLLSAGQFNLQASSFQTLPSMISFANMNNFVKSVIVTSNTNTSTAFFNFNVSVNVIGTDNYTYTGPCNLVLTEKSGSPIFGNSAVQNSIGSANYSIYFKTPGAKTIQASCGGVTGSTQVSVVPEVINFNGPNPLPQFSNNTFWLGVTVTDAFGNLESAANNPAGHQITLSLASNTSVSSYSLNGPLTMTAIGGAVNFTNLQILSSGNFVFKTTSDIGVANSTNPVSITNFVRNIVPHFPSLMSSFGNYSFSFNLQGDDLPNPYVLPTTANLYLNGSLFKTYQVNNGQISDFLSIPTPGVSMLKVQTSMDSLNIGLNSANLTIVPPTLQLSLSNMPSNSSSVFTPIVKIVESPVTNQVLPLADQIPVTLNIMCNGTCSGPAPTPITVNSTRGVATFPAMSLISSGKYSLQASSFQMQPSSVGIQNITNFVKNITLSILSANAVGAANITSFFNFNLNITVTGTDNNLFLGVCNMVISEASGSQVYGKSSFVTTTGQFVAPIYIKDSGAKNIVASCGGVSATLPIYVTPEVLKITSFTPNITSSNQTISLTVGIFDVNGNPESALNNPQGHTVYLSLVNTTNTFTSLQFGKANSTVLLGNKISMQAIGGNVTFSNLRVISNGAFDIVASTESPAINTTMTPAFTVVNHFNSCVSTYPSRVSANFDLPVQSLILAEDNMPLVTQNALTLSTNSSNLKTANSFVSTMSSSSVNYTVYFNQSGNYSMVLGMQNENAKCVLPVTVLQNRVAVTQVNSQPNSTNHNFQVTVTVNSNDGSQIESKRGVYQVNVLTPPNSPWSPATYTSANGVANFNLPVLADGIFNLTVGGNDLIPGTSTYFTTLGKIVINSNTTQPQKIWNPISFTLYNDLGNVFTGRANVYISCTNANYQVAQVITNNGTGNFSISFAAIGSAVCTIGVNNTSVTTTYQVNVVNNTYPDPKCVIALSYNQCSVCINNTYLDSSSNCQCIQNSYYNTSTNQCNCLPGYTPVQTYCAKCGNYFAASEITAFYAEDYKSIEITFARQIAQSLSTPNCSGIIQLPSSLSSLNPTCQWIGYTGISLGFSTIINSGVFTISFNPVLLTAVGNQCSLNVNALVIPVTYLYPMPVPYAGINVPQTYSTKCSNTSLSVSVAPQSINSDYQYSWTASISPDNSQLTSYILSQSSSSFTIDKSLLTSGSLVLGLTVTSSTFATSATATSTISVTGGSSLSPQFDAGSSVTIKVTDTRSFAVLIADSCGSNTTYNYNWTYSQFPATPALNFSNFLSMNSRPDTLFILPNSLAGGVTYTFVVNAYTGTIQGKASIVVTVQSSPLVLSLNRTDGVVRITDNIVVGASAYDPDNTNSTISYLWDCAQGSDDCVDNNNNTLAFNSTSSTLLVPSGTLQDQALYTFTVTAISKTKNNTATINLQVDSSVQGSVDYIDVPSIINNNYNYTVTAKVTLHQSASFLWIFTPPGNASVAIDNTNSYLVIPAGYLTPGTNYKIQLNLTFSSGAIASGYAFVAADLPPVCGSFTSVLSSGKWTLTGNSCHDSDTSDPVTYQFAGIYSSSRWVILSSGSYSNSISVRLSNRVRFTLLYVCDSMYMCTYYLNNITSAMSNKRRALSTLSDFQSDIINPSLIPSSIIYWADYITDQSTFDYIYGTFYSYFSSLYMNQQAFDSLLDCAYELLLNSTFVYTNSTQNNVTVLITTLANSYNSSLSTAEVTEILTMLNPYTYSIQANLLDNLLNVVGGLWMNNGALYTQLVYSNNLIFMRYRAVGSSLPGLSLSLSGSSVMIPSDFPVVSTNVYDLQYSSFNSTNNCVDLSIFVSGTYASSSLSLTSPIATEIVPVTPLTVTVPGTYNPSQKYKCVVYINGNWQSEYCTVTSVSNSLATIKLTHESLYSIVIDNNNCAVGSGPVAMMSVLIVIWVACLIVLYLINKNTKLFEENSASTQSLYFFHPISNLFIKQNSSRKYALISQVIASELLMLALIGAFYDKFDSPTSEFSAGFSDFYGKELTRGVSGWALSQAFTILVFALNTLAINRPKLYYISLILSIAIGALSAIGTIVMTSKYCAGYTTYWIINFLIFFVIDVVFVHLIYAAASLLLIVKKTNIPIAHSDDELKPAEYAKVFDNKNEVSIIAQEDPKDRTTVNPIIALDFKINEDNKSVGSQGRLATPVNEKSVIENDMSDRDI